MIPSLTSTTASCGMIIMILCLVACIKPPQYPLQPKITMVSISDTFIEQRAIIDVVFSFQDGDGDIGISNASGSCPDTSLCKPKDSPSSCYNNDIFDIFITDERTGCLILSGMVIPEIPKKGNSDAISGEFTVKVGPICCLPPDNTAGCIPNFAYPTDTIVCSVQIRDRAKNYSNKIYFGPLYIDCTK